MPRLFIALPIESDDTANIKPVFDYLSKHEILKTVEPGNYHITLKFLGECGEDIAREIVKDFKNIVVQHEHIPFTFSGAGVFPNLNSANVIWIGLETDEKIINHLTKNIEKLTSQLGFKKEKRRFTPHLTLARIRKGRKISNDLREYIIKNQDKSFGESSFKKLVLYSSQLTNKGPIYTELESIEFR